MKITNLMHLAILCVVMLFSSCNSGSEFKIALMFPYTTGSRMAIEEKAFREKAALMNCEVVVTDALVNDVLQRNQALELIAGGVDVIVIMAMNTVTAAEIVRAAHEKGVKVIGYDRLIQNCDLDFYISYNNYNVGRYMAEYTLRKVPEGKYFILAGDKGDRNAIFVRNGQIDALKASVAAGKVEIVYDTFVEDWNTENAYFFVKRYLKLSSNDVPDVILTSYDGLGYGARRALDEAGIVKMVLLTGQDAEPMALKNIVADRQAMTIYKPLKQLAEGAVEAAVKLAKGQMPDTTTSMFNNRINVPTYLFDPVVVDKNNLRETVINDGIITASELGL